MRSFCLIALSFEWGLGKPHAQTAINCWEPNAAGVSRPGIPAGFWLLAAGSLAGWLGVRCWLAGWLDAYWLAAGWPGGWLAARVGLSALEGKKNRNCNGKTHFSSFLL